MERRKEFLRQRTRALARLFLRTALPPPFTLPLPLPLPFLQVLVAYVGLPLRVFAFDHG